MNHTKTINKIIKEATSARKSLYEAILNLPDNNKVIEQTAKDKFVVNIKNLDNGILSPYYYIYSYQYKMVVYNLKTIQMHKILSYLSEILDKELIIYKNTRYKLNPEVVKNIRGILL